MDWDDSLDEETRQFLEAAMQSNKAEEVWSQATKRLRAKTRKSGGLVAQKASKR